MPGARLAIILGWPLLVLAAALVRLVRHRAHETESDRRAVELCGDPRALARALVKLHALALLPRRLAVEEERRADAPEPGEPAAGDRGAGAECGRAADLRR